MLRLSVFPLLMSFATTAFAADDSVFEVDFTLSHHISQEALMNCFAEISNWWPDSHTWSGSAENMAITLEPGGQFTEIVGTETIVHLDVVGVEGYVVSLSGGLGPLGAMGAYGPLRVDMQEPGELSVHYQVYAPANSDVHKMEEPVNQVMRGQFTALIEYCGA